ncbi:MAG: hypothetical protein IKC03_04855 [Oscillospiraceae bacterium]|nr:hypothetical protein [Oscillospiraceae bacterium]
MKQVNLTIAFEEEKHNALKWYMGKKELELEAELTDALTKLYEKYVPAPVREYIDGCSEPAPVAPKVKRTARSAEAKPSELKDQTQATVETEVN